MGSTPSPLDVPPTRRRSQGPAYSLTQRASWRRAASHGERPFRAAGCRAGGTRLAQFKALCRGCPLRQRCTISKTGRVLSVHPQHALLAAARRAATDPAWQAEYRRWRPPVEKKAPVAAP